MVEKSAPVSPVYSNRSMANRLRHYESWDAPAGFVAVGDAVCAFNPVYGQGMSTAAVCARILGDALARSDAADGSFPRRFLRAQARFLAQPWALSTGADLMFPDTEGDRPLAARVFSPYLRALTAAGASSRAIRMRFGEVVHMVRPAGALFAPRIAARVALHALRRGVAGQPAVATPPALPPPA